MDVAGKELTATDLWQLFEDEYRVRTVVGPQHRVLEEVGEGNASTVVLRADLAWDGETHPIEGRGNGPIDAFIQALSHTTGHSIRVVDYHQHAIGEGADAQAMAYLELRVDEKHTLFGVGRDANIISASLKAIVCGLERARAQGVAKARPVATVDN
jgi:2-isopropylmalate synthase